MSKYWPCPVEEMEDRGSFISQPLLPHNVDMLVPRQRRSFYAVLVENLNSTRALLRHLEDGVTVSSDAQREIIKLLFVASRHQEKALAAALELDGLE